MQGSFKMFYSQKVAHWLIVSIVWLFVSFFSVVFLYDAVDDARFCVTEACVMDDVDINEAEEEETFCDASVIADYYVKSCMVERVTGARCPTRSRCC